MSNQHSFVVICDKSEPYEAPNYQVVAAFSDRNDAENFLLTEAGTDCYISEVPQNPVLGHAVRKIVHYWSVYLQVSAGQVVEVNPRMEIGSIPVDENTAFEVFRNRQNPYHPWDGDVYLSGNMSESEAVSVATEIALKASALVKYVVSGTSIPCEFSEGRAFDNLQEASEWFREVKGSVIKGYTQDMWEGRKEDDWFEYGDGIEVKPVG